MTKESLRGIDVVALRTIVDWAIRSETVLREDSNATARERNDARAERRALVRAIAATIGGVYDIGYDRARNDAWHDAVTGVGEIIAKHAKRYEGGDWYAVDSAVRELVDSGRTINGVDTVERIRWAEMPLDRRQDEARNADGYVNGCEVHRDPLLSCAEDHPDV